MGQKNNAEHSRGISFLQLSGNPVQTQGFVQTDYLIGRLPDMT